MTRYQWNPLTNSLEDRNNPSPHISSADAKKNDPTAGAVYTSTLDQAAYPKAGTAPGEIVAAKKLSVTAKVQKLTDDLEKVKKNNEVLMKYGKPDKKFLDDLEPVKFEADIGFVGQMSGKKIDGMKEAVKMNDFFDVTDKKEWETLKRIQKINYETGTTPKPYWMEQEEKHKPDTRTPVQKKRDQFKAKQGGTVKSPDTWTVMKQTAKTPEEIKGIRDTVQRHVKSLGTKYLEPDEFKYLKVNGEIKIPGQPEIKPEVSNNTQMINDLELLNKQRQESQRLEKKFHEIMKPQPDPDMSKGIASVDGFEDFKKTVDFADSKWRNKRNNRTNYGLNTILGEPK